MLSATLRDVIEPQRHKSIREKELKLKMIKIIIDKIKKYSACGHTSCSFKVPPFILGYIMYNHESMIKYVQSKLYKEGFYVKQESFGILIISWNIKDIQMIQDNKRKEKLKIVNTNDDLKAFASSSKFHK